MTIHRSTVLLTIALVLGMPCVAVHAADATAAGSADPCAAMKAEKDTLKADRKAEEAAVAAQIAAMQAAPDNQKVALMAAIIARMQADQAAMEARKDAMEEKMMQAMMPADKPGAAKGCMMMKDMKDMPADATPAKAADMKDMSH
jgi:hypothetical protein